MEKVEFLSKIPLFESCSEKNVKSIAEQTRTRKFTAGDEIVAEGSQKTMGFYIILDGEAKVTRGEHHLGDYGPGDYFGEIALLLDDSPRTATVTATTDMTVLALARWDFKALLKTHPEIGVEVMGVLAQRLADTDKVLSD
jgi:CRP-like cAMP-binding protein